MHGWIASLKGPLVVQIGIDVNIVVPEILSDVLLKLAFVEVTSAPMLERRRKDGKRNLNSESFVCSNFVSKN